MIALALITLAGVFKSLSDAIAHGKIPYAGTWWDWKEGWKAKWKDGDPKQGEAFFLSSTVLVSLSDGWHLFNMLQYTALFAALPFYAYFMAGRDWWWHVAAVAVLRVAFGVAFEVCYRWVFTKKTA